MSQPSLKKNDDEQLLSTTLAIEIEDVKKTLAQLKLGKSKRTHCGPFSLYMDYYIKKFFQEMHSIDSRLQKLETREHPCDWNLYMIILKLENFSNIFTNAKLFEETKNKDDFDPNLVRDFCSSHFSATIMAIASLSSPSFMDVAQHLANRCLSLYL